MTFDEFLKIPNIVDKLLISLGILTRKRIIIKINNNPDYNISGYQREDEADYFFKNYWDFSAEKMSLTHVELIENRLLHVEDLEIGANEYELLFDDGDPFALIQSLYALNQDWFSENGMDTDIDQFRLKELRVIAIDNVNRRLHYEGSFFGNHHSFDSMDWGLYSLVEVTGVKRDCLPFYHDLVGEGFLLFKEQRYKLSYFMAYSAFESFVTGELSDGQVEQRLKEKVSDVYRRKFPHLEKHQLYTSLMDFYDLFTSNRNNIAHGHNKLMIKKQEAEKGLIFILVMICGYESDITTFDELKREL